MPDEFEINRDNRARGEVVHYKIVPVSKIRSWLTSCWYCAITRGHLHGSILTQISPTEKYRSCKYPRRNSARGMYVSASSRTPHRAARNTSLISRSEVSLFMNKYVPKRASSVVDVDKLPQFASFPVTLLITWITLARDFYPFWQITRVSTRAKKI